MTVKVSACITTYNRAEALDRTLGSLAAQTRLPDEVVVSDDGSSDETSAVAERWSERLPGFLYQRNPANLGMPGNLNAAIRRTTGTYVANLHDADTFAPTLLQRWEQALDENPSAGFVFCGIKGPRSTQETGDVLHDVAAFTVGISFFEQHLLHRFSSIVWGTVMARRTAYEVLLPFDQIFGFTSDVDMWMRMCRLFDVAYVREPLIELDHSDRKKGVDWAWVETARRMQLANIHRFYGDDSVRLGRELSRHKVVVRRFLLRRLLGRLRHGDWPGLRHAFLLLREWDRVPGLTRPAPDA